MSGHGKFWKGGYIYGVLTDQHRAVKKSSDSNSLDLKIVTNCHLGTNNVSFITSNNSFFALAAGKQC